MWRQADVLKSTLVCDMVAQMATKEDLTARRRPCDEVMGWNLCGGDNVMAHNTITQRAIEDNF